MVLYSLISRVICIPEPDKEDENSVKIRYVN